MQSSVRGHIAFLLSVCPIFSKQLRRRNFSFTFSVKLALDNSRSHLKSEGQRSRLLGNETVEIVFCSCLRQIKTRMITDRSIHIVEYISLAEMIRFVIFVCTYPGWLRVAAAA